MKVVSILDDIEGGRLESFLGGTPEGIVIKNYGQGNKWPKLLKLVSSTFKEVHAMKKSSSTKIKSAEDFIEIFGKQYAVTARWSEISMKFNSAGIGRPINT